MALKQYLSQRLDQRLSPQQIQLMKLLQIPTVELSDRIQEEMEDNPVLENDEMLDFTAEETTSPDDFQDNQENERAENDDSNFDISAYFDQDTPDYKTQTAHQSDTEERTIPMAEESSFRERLLEQLYLLDLTETQYLIANSIIGNLDDAGYLSRSIESLVDDLAFSINLYVSQEQVEEVLRLLQEFDPAGIAARDLRECLVLQLKRKQNGNITKFTALKILEDYFDDFTKKHYQSIQRKLEIEEDDLRDAIEEITKLNPKPGGASGSSRDTDKNVWHITPDFTVFEFEGKLELTLNRRNAPDLKINRSYENLLKNYAENATITKEERKTLLFVRQKIESAKWFIDAIKQRHNTLLITMTAIMNYQRDFFLSGDESQLRPMILKDIADSVGLDISTISRVVNSKYVQTNYGIFSLRYFFSEAVASENGEEISTREIKKILVEAVEMEDKQKPLTDDRLTELFFEKGYAIARRTIAKYREQLNIPVARLRREL